MLEPLDLPSALARAVSGHAERTALVDRHARYSFRELDEAANRAAQGLRELGVQGGDRVALSLPNGADLAIALLGTWKLGAVWVGVHPVLAPPEKAHQLDDSGAKVLLADPRSAGQVGRDSDRRRQLEHIVCVDPGSPDSEWAARLGAADPSPPDVVIDPLAPAAIAYTSGTTGLPKGAVHSQHNGLLPGAVSVHRDTIGPEETIGNMLPMTIFNLNVLGVLTSIQAGCKYVVMDTRDAPGIARWIRQERVAYFTSVPAVVHDLLTHPEVDPDDLNSLTQPRVGGSNSPEWFRRLFRERFGKDLSTSYALTEGPTLVTREDAGDERVPGSCGRALPHIEVTIRGADDAELPVGETGEICIGPRREGRWKGVYRTVLGYWEQPERSAESLRGGRFHTGDLGRIDAEGRVFVVERRSELIIRGGSNIYPSEIERVLRQDERVADCAVVGRPEERLGETVVAFVEPAAGPPPPAVELLARCRENLARYKVPEEILFVDAFARGAMGKIDRAALRRRVEEAP